MGLSLAALMWATVRLDPARVAGEHMHPLEIAGGALVVSAGPFEVWPVRRPRAGKA
ncbi:MAG: hypothetical protein HWE37_00415 [Rhodobacteraceae bacterium]|nr:hypothetical protein [Paracoccaceae bacterium]